MQYCQVCGETRCARVDAECRTPCVNYANFIMPLRTEYKGLAQQAEFGLQAFGLQRESAMARNVYGSAEEWLSATVSAAGIDPDGAHVPLPPKPAPFREFEPQKHDFIAALLRPYVPPV